MEDELSGGWEDICREAFFGCSYAKDKDVFYEGDDGRGPCVEERMGFYNCRERRRY